MKTLIIGFSTPKKWRAFPALIRLRDRTKYSHSYWRFPSKDWGVDFIYQNSGLHTNFTTSVKFENINKIIDEYEIEVDDERYKKIARLCALREGKNYAILEVLGKGLIWFFEIVSFGKLKIKNPFSDGDNTTDCIQEAAKILEGLSIKVTLDMDSVSVKPWHDFVTSLYGFKRREPMT